MITFHEVRSGTLAGRRYNQVFSCLSMQLPTNRRLAILVKSAEVRQDLVGLICGTKEQETGEIERGAYVSYPIGFSSGLYPKLTVLGNINFVASLFGLDRPSFIDLVVSLLGANPQLKTNLGDLPPTFKSYFGYCLSYAIPFDVYVANNILIPGDETTRKYLKPLVDARVQSAGLILVTGSVQVAQTFCQEATVLHEEQLKSFSSVKAAVSFFREL